MDDITLIARIEKAREQIVAAKDDREALLIAFTELAALIIEIKHPDEGTA
jgi:hypothetical protein